MKKIWVSFLLVGLVAITSTVLAETKQAVFVTLSGWEMPPAYHGNPYAPGGVGGATDYVHARLFYYYAFTGEYKPYLAEGFVEEDTDKDGLIDKLTVLLRKDITWEDGTPFTSRDVYAQYIIGGAAWTWGHIWKYLDFISIPDPYTVVFYYEKPTILLTTY